MTRINAGIEVVQLTDQHLVAEYREILRVGSLFKKRIENNKGFNDAPNEFTFGKGHVAFFFQKGLYINIRWHQLYEEIKYRGFKPTLEFFDHWENYPQYKLDYTPSVDVISLVKARIHNNILNQKSPIRYKSQIIPMKEYFDTYLKTLTD